MAGWRAAAQRLVDRRTLRDDAMAGLVLGVESVPDGLASGLLAGVNPVAGLYAYMYGSFAGAMATSTSFMAVQGTGAMAIIVADAGLGSSEDPARALFTLSVLTGILMVAAGLFRLGSVLRFVSNSVMVGFISAVGVNIVLGQLDTFSGYESEGANRILRAVDLLLNLGEADPASLAVGAGTLALIVVLQRTRLGPMGLVVAVVAGSVLAAVLAGVGVAVDLVGDIADVPRSLPLITRPLLTEVPGLLIPALALTFVGFVQGAGVSSGFPNPDGTATDMSRDFVAQGLGNVASGLFQGMPVGGSMSATSLVATAGARTRAAVLIAGLVMAGVILLLADAVALVAMPALAGLLIVVGFATIKPAAMINVAKTGNVQATVMSVTFLLTLVIPLQYAVLAGVGLSILMYVVRQSNRLTTSRLYFEDGGVREGAPPAEVPPDDVVVLQPYGSLFFASAPSFEAQLPVVTPATRNAVVILRLRGTGEVGNTFIEVLRQYAIALTAADSRLMIVTDSKTTRRQLFATGAADDIGEDNIRSGTEWQLQALRHAYEDARSLVAGDHEEPL